MDSAELQKLAQHTRRMREAGMALLVASGLLALFLFIPLGPQAETPAITAATSTAPNAFANVPIQATAAIVYDLVTRKTLFEKNADAQLPLASLTKLLTVYAALAELSPETPITISPEAAALEMPRTFNEGQTFALADLARLTLTASLNDGAAAILEAIAARKGASGAQALAGAAAALDLGQTFAVNGSGLDISTTVAGGYGSARDLAVVAGALLSQSPEVAEATTKATAYAVSAGGTAYTVKNTDPIIDSIPGLLLSKTGFTDLAGGNLVLVFDTGLGHPVVAVVLGSTANDRFSDGSALVSATFNHFTNADSL